MPAHRSSRWILARLAACVLALGLGGGAAAPAHASEWERIGQAPLSAGLDDPYRGTRTLSVHRPTLQRNGDLVEYWTEDAIDPPVTVRGLREPVIATREKRQANCATGVVRVLSGNYTLASRGTSPYPYGAVSGIWTVVEPDSADALAVRQVCRQTQPLWSRWLDKITFW